MIEILIGLWFLIGLWSFIITQNTIKGWDYIKSQPNPYKFFISSMLMGPITTLICFYTLFKYYQGGKSK